MPSRAYTSFLQENVFERTFNKFFQCQCPLGLIPHFYRPFCSTCARLSYRVNALSGLYLISTKKQSCLPMGERSCVNALSGLYLISTTIIQPKTSLIITVSMPSRAYTSFLRFDWQCPSIAPYTCQCPLGLIPHFYLFLATYLA